MSDSYVPAKLRRLVRSRAKNCCEYCGISEAETWLGCEVDHIISEKHSGQTIIANLALACVACNRAKGSDISTVDEKGALIELFNPRRHLWAEHFVRKGPRINGKTPLGKATVRLLRFNAHARLEERLWRNFPST